MCLAGVWVGGYFFFQAEDGIRVTSVTGVQTCALPILCGVAAGRQRARLRIADWRLRIRRDRCRLVHSAIRNPQSAIEIGRASSKDRAAITRVVAAGEGDEVKVFIDRATGSVGSVAGAK